MASSPIDHPVSCHIASKETSADESNVWADRSRASLRRYLGFLKVKAHYSYTPETRTNIQTARGSFANVQENACHLPARVPAMLREPLTCMRKQRAVDSSVWTLVMKVASLRSHLWLWPNGKTSAIFLSCRRTRAEI